METNRELTELVRRIEESSRKQQQAIQFLCILAVICIASCVAMAIWVGGLLPQISGVMSQMQEILEDLDAVTEQLGTLDLVGMVRDVDALVSSAQATMESINHIDFETLNQAIGDLAAIIEPLAKWFR